MPHADTSSGWCDVRNTYLVTYDICDEKRLARVHKTMRGFGDHLQYSVFECQFTRTDLVRCRHSLSEIIDHRQDQVLFIDLGPSEGRGERVITALGRAYAPIDAPCIIVDRERGRSGHATQAGRRSGPLNAQEDTT